MYKSLKEKICSLQHNVREVTELRKQYKRLGNIMEQKYSELEQLKMRNMALEKTLTEIQVL